MAKPVLALLLFAALFLMARSPTMGLSAPGPVARGFLLLLAFPLLAICAPPPPSLPYQCGNCTFNVTDDGALQRSAMDPSLCGGVEHDCCGADCYILYLVDQGIRSFSPGVFWGLRSLQFLFLDQNEIDVLPPGIFDNLTSLSVISLGSNKIDALPPDIFENLMYLERLFLNNNKIENLTEGVFENLWSLQMLGLGGNNIKTLPPAIFESQQNLAYLDLGGNNISIVDNAFYYLESVEELTLCYPDELYPDENDTGFTASITVATGYLPSLRAIAMCKLQDDAYMSSSNLAMPNSIRYAYNDVGPLETRLPPPLQKVYTWFGDLVISHFSDHEILNRTLPLAVFPSLQSVSGSLILRDTHFFESVLLPNLVVIGGRLVVENNTNLKLFSVPSLREVEHSSIIGRLPFGSDPFDIPNVTTEGRECNRIPESNDTPGVKVADNPELERLMLGRLNCTTRLVVTNNPNLVEVDFTGHNAIFGSDDEFCDTFKHSDMTGNADLSVMQPPWLGPAMECTCPDGYVLVERAEGDRYACVIDYKEKFWKEFFIPLLVPLAYSGLLLIVQKWHLHQSSPMREETDASEDDEVLLASEGLGFGSSNFISFVMSVLLGVADLVTDILFITQFNTCDRLRIPAIIFVCLPTVMLLIGAAATLFVQFVNPTVLSGGPSGKYAVQLRWSSGPCLLALDAILGFQVVCLCAADLKAIILLPWNVGNVPQEPVTVDQAGRVEDPQDVVRRLTNLEERADLQSSLAVNGNLPDWQRRTPVISIWMRLWSVVEDVAQFWIQLRFLTSAEGPEGCYPSLSEATGTTVSMLFSCLRFAEQVLMWIGRCRSASDGAGNWLDEQLHTAITSVQDRFSQYDAQLEAEMHTRMAAEKAVRTMSAELEAEKERRTAAEDSVATMSAELEALRG